VRARVLIGLAALATTAIGTAAFSREDPEEAAVRAALDHYLMGHATGDPQHFRLVFHPDSKLYFNRDGKFGTRTAEEYISGAAGKPADDEAQRKRRIVSVDVAGDAAQAKIELDYPTVFFTDYFNLLKVDGKWMIVNKTFNAKRK
jgi:hypothetical protein